MNYKKLFLFVVLIISFFVIGSKVQAAGEVKGWAWSDGIGWLSFNCLNGDALNTGAAGTCATSNYKVTFSTTTTTGTFGGYAWSPNIGWISFNESTGCPEGTCRTTVDLLTGAVTGWARACAGTVSGDCLGASRTDGWDGWARISGPNYESPNSSGPGGSSNRGVTFSTTTGNFSGYAWGGNNIGWLSFSAAGPFGGQEVQVDCEPTCGPTEETSNLDLEVNADGTGWYSSTSIMANSSNNAMVVVRWDLENVSNVRIANNTDGVVGWPGASVNDTSFGGKSFSADDQVSVTFTGITTTTVKKLRLSYWDSENTVHYKEVTITIYPNGVPPILNCSTPTNAQLCTGSSYAPNMTSVLRATSALCTSITTPLACEFYCPQGFKIVGNMCRRSGTIIER